MTITVGQSLIAKQGGMSLGTQGPISPSPAVEASYTQEPTTVEEVQAKKVLTHRHFGHPEEHPVTLRHRKASIDPMHNEEDKIIDEYKDLYDKAKKGECNPLEMKRVHQLRGRLHEIQASRESDARRILGDDMLEAAAGFSLAPPKPPQQSAPPKITGNNLLTQTASARSGKTFKSYPIKKTVDSAIMATDSILKSHRGEPHYPADLPEDYGIHGSMTDPTEGEVVSDIRGTLSKAPHKGCGDPSCASAKGNVCECSCHGGNHAKAGGMQKALVRKPIEKDGTRQYLKPGEEPPQDASIQEGPRGGRFISGDGPSEASASSNRPPAVQVLGTPFGGKPSPRDQQMRDAMGKVNEKFAQEYAEEDEANNVLPPAEQPPHTPGIGGFGQTRNTDLEIADHYRKKSARQNEKVSGAFEALGSLNVMPEDSEQAWDMAQDPSYHRNHPELADLPYDNPEFEQLFRNRWDREMSDLTGGSDFDDEDNYYDSQDTMRQDGADHGQPSAGGFNEASPSAPSNSNQADHTSSVNDALDTVFGYNRPPEDLDQAWDMARSNSDLGHLPFDDPAFEQAFSDKWNQITSKAMSVKQASNAVMYNGFHQGPIK